MVQNLVNRPNVEKAGKCKPKVVLVHTGRLCYNWSGNISLGRIYSLLTQKLTSETIIRSFLYNIHELKYIPNNNCTNYRLQSLSCIPTYISKYTTNMVLCKFIVPDIDS